ncbi:hypothetical protein YC2023_069082 [Brassica napus]
MGSNEVWHFQKINPIPEVLPNNHFEEMCSNFVMNDSNRDVVEIGLIGSNGIPTFLPLTPTHLNNSNGHIHYSNKLDGCVSEYHCKLLSLLSCTVNVYKLVPIGTTLKQYDLAVKWTHRHEISNLQVCSNNKDNLKL